MTSETSDLATAQAELRFGYRSASVGQIYAGAVWLVSGATWIWVGTLPGVLVLVVGGFLIYPVTSLVCRLLGNPGSVSPANPLREASVTIPIVGALGIPVAGAAALYEIEWFFPAFMVVMGAHYLPFSHLYGMRIFLPLGAGMWLAGMSIGMWARGWSGVVAILTGVGLVAVGLEAAVEYRKEFTRAATG
jgi:hypothetical protein